MSFEGQVAIVTGGASGIGRALCDALVGRGAQVIVADIDGDGARAVAAELGPAAVAAELDVRDAAATDALVADTVAANGRVDLMFNNAGIAVIGDLVDTTADDWDRLIDVNVRGVVNGVRAVYPHMIEQGSGHIVNIASLAGLIASPGLTAYSATKHAVVGLSRGMRVEAAPHGVRVSAVCPGFVKTNIARAATTHGMTPDEAEARVPFWYPADACARDVLRGIRRNQGIIVVTGHGKQLYRLGRYAPALLERIARFGFQRDRKRRA